MARSKRYAEILAFLKPRYARCGACGREEKSSLVEARHLKRGRYSNFQYNKQPDHATDVYYCGCEDYDNFDYGTWWDPYL